ncbi:hypothetical protein [Rickettsia endosymbiont of Culicoides newsteadi]|uniref:hypothetical protein n=1 Tax=Rickettsia endosymbiont of Culicoides newsteadi TaxID=1961830 RepID=UPI000B9B5965|nr:hypothetical protein [Rickettsia endosymbiont of Culicoides newsteadi]OZG31249.1 hypothetical protein RiCNE_13640 [Rickettsia endosymbiont of Culicoides newsteadi]
MSDDVDSSNSYSEEYSSEKKFETEASNIADIKENSLYKENFVTKCLNHWTIIHQYYQNLKKNARFSQDKTSDYHQEKHQLWNIPNKGEYTTENKNIVNIGSKKHHNIYAIIDPDLLGSLDISKQKAFITALEKGVAKDSNHNGVKILGKYLPELKINKDSRLLAEKIYKNKDGAVLMVFGQEYNHTAVKKEFQLNTIKVIPVSGAAYTQEKDDILKPNIFPEDYFTNTEDYPDDEVECTGEES